MPRPLARAVDGRYRRLSRRRRSGGRRRQFMAASSLSELVARLERALAESPSTPLRVSGLRGSAPALSLARILGAQPRPIVVTLPTGTEAEAFAADLRFFLGEVGTGPLSRRVHYLP